MQLRSTSKRFIPPTAQACSIHWHCLPISQSILSSPSSSSFVIFRRPVSGDQSSLTHSLTTNKHLIAWRSYSRRLELVPGTCPRQWATLTCTGTADTPGAVLAHQRQKKGSLRSPWCARPGVLQTLFNVARLPITTLCTSCARIVLCGRRSRQSRTTPTGPSTHHTQYWAHYTLHTRH